MHEQFRETDKAIAYFLSGLNSSFPDETLEVIQIEPHKFVRVLCKTRDVASLLRRYCRRYQNATVNFHPDNKFGFVGEIRSHSNHDSNQSDRPRVIVQRARVRNEEELSPRMEVGIA